VRVLIVSHDRNAMAHRVQLGFLALSSRTGVSGVFAHREAYSLRAFAPFKVIGAFFVGFLPAGDDYEVLLDAAVRGEDYRAIPPSMRCLDPFW